MTAVFADPHVRDAGAENVARERVKLILRGGGWVRASVLTAPEYGGSEGLRRLRELRARGWKIEMCRVAGGTERQYRLVSEPVMEIARSTRGAPPKSAVKALLDETRDRHRTAPFSGESVVVLQWLAQRFKLTKGTTT